jgi:Cytochrome P460
MNAALADPFPMDQNERGPPLPLRWEWVSLGRIVGTMQTKPTRMPCGIGCTSATGPAEMKILGGSIIAALHWNEESSDGDNKVLAEGFPGLGLQAAFAGSPVNVQFMVKDSKKYAASGGWGFADFANGKPADLAVHEKCWPCHEPGRDRDYVFTRYAPTP